MTPKIDTDSLDAFTIGFIECLLWQATDDKDEPLDMYDIEDIDEAGLTEIVQDCADFQAAHADLLEQAGDDSQNGHDFCLTRNGHGAGFWDRGYGAVGEELSDACKPYGTLDAYLGDDERIYIHN